MTPEERAAQLWFELNILLPPLPKSWSAVAVNEACQAMIKQAIERAIAAEREACALVVDNHYPNGRASDLDTIAAAIRARSNSESRATS